MSLTGTGRSLTLVYTIPVSAWVAPGGLMMASQRKGDTMGFPIKHKSQYILEAIRMAVACEETADRLTYLAHRALNKGEHEAYNRLISEATTARIEADRYQRKAVELAFILKQEVDSAK